MNTLRAKYCGKEELDVVGVVVVGVVEVPVVVVVVKVVVVVGVFNCS